MNFNCIVFLYLLSFIWCIESYLRGSDSSSSELFAKQQSASLELASAPYFKEGELLRFHLSKQVYCVKDGKKIAVDHDDFVKFSWKLEEVRVIQSAYEMNIFDHMPDGPKTLLFSYDSVFGDGELVRFHIQKQIYKIENQRKRPIMTQTAFIRNGWDFDDVHVIETSRDVDALNAMPLGQEII